MKWGFVGSWSRDSRENSAKRERGVRCKARMGSSDGLDRWVLLLKVRLYLYRRYASSLSSVYTWNINIPYSL